MRRRDVGEVQDDRRPELHVRLDHAVGAALAQLLERGGLEGLGDLVARGVELQAGPPEHAGPRVLGAVDAVAEAHQPLAAVQDALDVALGVAGALDLLEHVQHAAGRTAVQRPGHGADGPGDRRGDVRAGRGDHARGERGGVHPVLGGGDEVGVDRADVHRVGLAVPADHHALDDRATLVDQLRGHHRHADPTGGLRGEGHGHDRHPGEVVAGLVVVDVQQGLQAPGGGQHGDRGLHVDAHVARVHRDRVRLGRRQAGVELVVDQQAPDLAERHAADEVLDVHAAVAQRRALLVRLGDLGLERDDTLKAGYEVGHGSLLRGWRAGTGTILPDAA